MCAAVRHPYNSRPAVSHAVAATTPGPSANGHEGASHAGQGCENDSITSECRLCGNTQHVSEAQQPGRKLFTQRANSELLHVEILPDVIHALPCAAVSCVETHWYSRMTVEKRGWRCLAMFPLGTILWGSTVGWGQAQMNGHCAQARHQQQARVAQPHHCGVPNRVGGA